jgi:hypothetical protein
MKKYLKYVAIALVAVVSLAACSDSKEADQGGQNARDEQRAVSTGFSRLADSQQIPSFDWSQERQTLIDVETIRANGATSTSRFFLEGVGLVGWCPSTGAAVPSSFQLSSTSQYVDLPGDDTRTQYPIDQGEPTGVYVGDSTGTWVICLDDAGNKFGQYWEGYVMTTVGVVDGLPSELRIRISESTFEFTERPR